MFGRVIAIFFSSVFVGVIFTGNIVLAEAQFGGVVEHYMYCDCSNNYYLLVGDPHGGQYIQNNSTDLKECQPPTMGEWVLGMDAGTSEDCEITVLDECVVFASGTVIDYFGASQSGGCTNGIGGDASGDGKTEMVTSDGRKSDGNNESHLATSNHQDYEGANNGHMLTPDKQNDEGTKTTHMSVDGRMYDGAHETVMTVSGSDNGYSAAGGGRPGGGHGSTGGSMGSLGLGSPGGAGSSRTCPDNCSASVAGMTSQCSGVANGGRPHFRFGSSGGAVCPGTCTVKINCGGQTESYVINNGANRDDRGGFLWKPASESDGNLVILGPSSMVTESGNDNGSSASSGSSSSSSSNSRSSANSTFDQQSTNNNGTNNTTNSSTGGNNNSTSNGTDTNGQGGENGQNRNQSGNNGNNSALGTSLVSILGGLTNGKEMLRMLFVIMSIGGAGYFVFKAVKKVV